MQLKKKVKDTTEEKTLLEKVEEDLQRDEIKMFENGDISREYLTLPNDLTELEGKELGKYFTVFTKEKMYVRTLIARTNVILRDYKEKLDSIKDEIFSALPPKMSVAEKNLRVRGNEKAKDLLEKVAFYEEKLNMLSMYLESLSEGIFAISREISRRESDWDEENRENNIVKKDVINK